MIEVAGERWGTAAQIAVALGDDVTVTMVRNWSRRDGLQRMVVGRMVYYRFAQAADIERAKRLGGRGRPRELDFALTLARSCL